MPLRWSSRSCQTSSRAWIDGFHDAKSSARQSSQLSRIPMLLPQLVYMSTFQRQVIRMLRTLFQFPQYPIDLSNNHVCLFFCTMHFTIFKIAFVNINFQCINFDPCRLQTRRWTRRLLPRSSTRRETL